MNYRLKRHNNSKWVSIQKDNKQEALAMDEEAALHAIWVMEGKNKDEFYEVDENDVVVKKDVK